MPDAKVVFRATVRGAGKAADEIGSVADALDRAITEEFAAVGERAQRVFRQAAPRDTGELSDSVTVEVLRSATRPKLTITAGADRDGFDYLPVTRYGHRRSVIRVRTARGMPIRWEGRNATDAPVRRSARGYRPGRDWVDAAGDLIAPDLDGMADRIGRQVTRRVL